jgi:hypothetical protein
MKRHTQLIFIFLILIFHIPYAFCQDTENIDSQSWLDFRAYIPINDLWTYDGDYGVRGILSGEDWQRVYINPSALYTLSSRTAIRGGIRFIYTNEITTSNTFEIRPWQGIRFIWPRTKFMIVSQYARLEERFTFYTEDNNSDFVVRARYRIMAKTPNISWKSINQTFYFLASFEFFANLGTAIEETYVDRTRLTFGLGYILSKLFRFELDYILQSSRKGSEEGAKFGVHILRLRLKYYIN